MGGQQGRRWLARALGLALLLQMVVAPARVEALDWHLPGRRDIPTVSRPGAEASWRRLQEVPPPAWVQKARLALEDQDPTVRILAPADGEILPDGPWTLRLQVGDWPLVDAGPLGLGPHLVVQLDGEPPRPTVATELEMPPLSPGSHLLTVYAAKPWGEAHKSPLALRQIRIHRLAPNPATLPAPGTPQLLPVSPSGRAGSPPLLLDWLLIDTPLQGLRSDSAGWRLRLTVNGESVLVDQQTPLWLQGWKLGGNALLLELLDGRGEPLNPPFNSVLQEVVVSATGASGSARAPAAPLTDLELAVLLGEQPASALAPPPASPTPEPPAAIDRPAAPEEPPAPVRPAPAERPAAPVEDVPSPLAASPPADDRSAAEPATDGQPPAAEPSAASTTSPPTALSPPLITSPPSIAPSSSGPESGLGSGSSTSSDSATGTGTSSDSPTEGSAPAVPPAPDLPESTAVAPQASAPLDGPPAGTTPAPAGPVATTRSAREEVNTDGTLRRSARPSALQGLRERLGR